MPGGQDQPRPRPADAMEDQVELLTEADDETEVPIPGRPSLFCCGGGLLDCRCTRGALCQTAWLCGWLREAVSLLKLAVPIVMTLVLQQLLLLVSLLFVGHITGRAVELDAAALGYSFVNVTGVLVGLGLSTAADTLSAQTYGLKDFKKVGVVLQRGILVLTVAMFPVWALWLNTEWILVLLQQPPCVTRLAAQYVLIFSLALPSVFLYTVLQKYLQTQGVVWTVALIGLLTVMASVLCHGILIYPLKLGFIGSPVAIVIANSASPLMLLGCVWFFGLHRETWGGWSWEALTGWGQFAKLGIPGLLMIIFEWCSIEVSAFVAGSIDEVQLGINAIIITILNVVYVVPFGLSIAITIRVGNELGAGNPSAAKRASYTAIIIIMCSAVLTSAVLGSCRRAIGSLFTEDKDIIDGVAVVMYIVVVLVFSDGIQATVAGVLRGSGRQVFGAAVNFVAYFVVGLPVGIVLALVGGLGTMGIWLGLTGGNMLQALVYLAVVWRTDWERQARRATSELRVGKETRQVDVQLLSVTALPDPVDSQSNSTHALLDPVGSQSNSTHDLPDPVGSQSNSTHDLPDPVGSQSNSTHDLPDSAGDLQAQPVPTCSKVKLLVYRACFVLCGVVVLLAGCLINALGPYPITSTFQGQECNLTANNGPPNSTTGS